MINLSPAIARAAIGLGVVLLLVVTIAIQTARLRTAQDSLASVKASFDVVREANLTQKDAIDELVKANGKFAALLAIERRALAEARATLDADRKRAAAARERARQELDAALAPADCQAVVAQRLDTVCPAVAERLRRLSRAHHED